MDGDGGGRNRCGFRLTQSRQNILVHRLTQLQTQDISASAAGSMPDNRGAIQV
jgi:hypothetical protein